MGPPRNSHPSSTAGGTHAWESREPPPPNPPPPPSLGHTHLAQLLGSSQVHGHLWRADVLGRDDHAPPHQLAIHLAAGGAQERAKRHGRSRDAPWSSLLVQGASMAQQCCTDVLRYGLEHARRHIREGSSQSAGPPYGPLQLLKAAGHDGARRGQRRVFGLHAHGQVLCACTWAGIECMHEFLACAHHMGALASGC